MREGVALVADIGRQSVRFALTGDEDSENTALRDVKRVSTASHSTFTSALLEYLRDAGLQDRRLRSVLAVAGAPRGDLINLTGSRWFISLSGIEAVLREPPVAMNECAANALALTRLDEAAFKPLPGPAFRQVKLGGSYAVIGVGTGLGVSALVSSGKRLVAVQSEAGHMAFAPASAAEEAFVRLCTAKGITPEAETLLSANGLLLAYQSTSNGRQLARPEDVTANVSRDPAAAAAVKLFVEHLGAFARDLVLAFAAWDGVFLTGPIARALQGPLAQPGFRARMHAGDSFRRQIATVPVSIVCRDDLELIGAAAALESH